MFEWLKRKPKPAKSRNTAGRRTVAGVTVTDPRLMNSRAFKARRDIVESEQDHVLFGPTVEAVAADHAKIRRASRYLAHNDPHIARGISAFTNACVRHGIRISVKGDDGFAAFVTEWTTSFDADFEGRTTFGTAQAIQVRGTIEAGDGPMILRDKMRNGQLWPTYQLIDAEQLDESVLTPKKKGNAVTGGVEVDATGCIVGYHVRSAIDSISGLYGAAAASQFVPVADMIHMMEIRHPGQLRGVPFAATATDSTRARGQLINSAIAKSFVDSSMPGVIENISGEDDDTGFRFGGDDDGDPDTPMGSNVVENGDGTFSLQQLERLEPGTIPELPKGKRFVPISIPAVESLETYIKIQMQTMSVAQRTPYSVMSGDASDLNYSTATVEAFRFQEDVDAFRTSVVYPAIWKVIARLKRAYEINTGNEVTAKISLVPPGHEHVDPAKAAAADMIHLLAGGQTWTQYCLKKGLDPDEQRAELKAERALLADDGIDLQFGGTMLSQLIELAMSGDDEDPPEDDEEPWRGRRARTSGGPKSRAAKIARHKRKSR